MLVKVGVSLHEARLYEIDNYVIRRYQVLQLRYKHHTQELGRGVTIHAVLFGVVKS